MDVWDELGQEAVRHLQRLIRFDTSNPPGNETPAAEYVAQTLARGGIESQVLECAPGRGNAVARLRGSGQEAPLLLMAHLDVVPARAEDWTHDPFGGEVADGYVWGRGAIDTKNATAVHMTAMLALARLGIPFKRDLLLGAMADEEVGGSGANFLAQEHPEWVTAEYALNEGGGDALVVGGRRFYTFQMAQKGGVDIRMIGHGKAGHSSVPYPTSAISQLAEAIVKLKAQPLPHRVTDTTRRFFNSMAEAVEDPRLADALRDMLDPERAPSWDSFPGLDGETGRIFWAMMRNMAEVTMLQAGYKSNVMPAEAEAVVNGRALPGVGLEDIVGEVRDIVGEGVELVPGDFHAGIEFDLPDDDPLLEAARYGIRRWDADGIVVPYLCCGGTDAAYLAPLGTQVVGFTPMQPGPEGSLLQLAHGNDERITVSNLSFGVKVVLDMICHLNGVDNPLG